ncbi:MAG: NAD(P)-dependent oxidoreductase, partial [Clostridia bacterium]|nr:NAD(P)-dependent oxidoreductase [Clostridia bacterium]
MKNILIIGGKGTLRDELNHKLSREGNHVYLLSNGKKKAGAPREYFYPYDSDSVREALDSSNPNTIVFLGAYDPAFSWSVRTEQKDYKAYISGLTNILNWAEAAGVHRFVYLSSECVFEDHYLSPIAEDMPPTPRTTKGIAVSLGESIVNNYASHQRMDVVVVRMAHLYMLPQNARECTDIYTRLCLQAAAHGRMEINAKIHRSALYVGDGVQALLLLLSAAAHRQPLYHITSETSYTEDQAAALIQSASSRSAVIDDRTVGMEHSILLSDHYFAEEFGFSAIHDLDETIPKIMKQIQGNLRPYTTAADSENAENKSHFMRILTRLVPFIEALMVFVLVVLAEIHLSDSEFFIHVDFFMLYVLLFALFHGLHQSIFTSALSVIGYFLTRLGDSSSLEILMDVGTYIWIAQIFIMGMSVGHLKDRLLQLQSDKDDEINYLALRLGDISDINKSNVTIKNYFEQQTINSTESLGYFYDIVAQLDAANENEVLFVAVQLLSRIMGTEDVAIYSIGSSGYFRLLASTSKNASAPGKSLHSKNYASVFET